MNSHLRSVGKNFPPTSARVTFTAAAMFLSLTACTLVQRKVVAPNDLLREQTITTDKKTIEELRKNIPPEKREQNDQLAILLSLMGEIRFEPSAIRSRFDRETRQRRADFRRTAKRTRRDFSRKEKRERDEFLDQLKKAREDFKSNSPDREETKKFFAEQSLQRKDFFADQKDRRKDFESESRQKSKDFNAGMREWRRQFNQELRAYSQRYRDWKKTNPSFRPSPAVLMDSKYLGNQ